MQIIKIYYNLVSKQDYDMYKLIYFFFCFIFNSLDSKGQCVPDENFIPVLANYGLSPDTLATGYVNQNYNQDLTFVLPLRYN